MSENKKPRLAEVLGVEVGERFNILSAPNNPYYVSEFGWLVDKNDYIISNWINRIINEPDLIKRRPSWTEQEVENAKAIKQLAPRFEYIERSSSLGMVLYTKQEWGSDNISLPDFPSMETGQRVALDDIIGGRE